MYGFEGIQGNLKKIEEENKNATPAEKYTIKNDALVKVLGPERQGRVRGLGFGAKPSHVGAQTYTCDRVIKLEKEVEELKNIVNSLLAGSKRKHANSFPCVSANAQGFGSLEANSANQASSPNIQANSANCKAKSVNLRSSANHKAIDNDALEASSANHKAKSTNLLSKSVNLEAFSTHHHGEDVDKTLLSRLLKMFKALGIYSESFETPYLEWTYEFYAAEGTRLREEHERCLLYLDASTEKSLVGIAEKQLLDSHISISLDKGFTMLMDGSCIEDLQRMYTIFSRVNALESLRLALSSYIWRTGQEIITCEEEDEMVASL
ncbi:hypothetical protein ACE6H2_000941 [Prunus campanulata]